MSDHSPDIATLVPHAGAMCLLDRVVSWDAATITCESASHVRPGHPLARDGVLPAVAAIEYAAQAMAAHAVLQARAQASGAAAGAADPLADPRPGFLVSVRDVALAVPRLDDLPAPLRVTATRVAVGPGGLLYDFDVRAGDLRCVSGRATVMIPPASP